MKSKMFSSHNPGHGGNKKHHTGHPHGHPTEHGLKGVAHSVHGSEDSGTMAEHGLSQGNKPRAKGFHNSQSILEDHGLQHVDYENVVGSGFYGGDHDKD